MVLSRLFGHGQQADPAARLYSGIVEQSRQPNFYRDCAVPDSVDGRFELIALHVFLVLHHLKAGDGTERDLGQALFDTFVRDMDASLREMGAGDLGVGKRVKTMIRGLFGRIAAYEAALKGGSGELEGALARNLYGTTSAAPQALEAMAGYLRREVQALETQRGPGLVSGELRFGLPPGPLLDPNEP